jgi:CheY-like chemotaxis protein
MSRRLIIADDSSTIQKVVELFLEPEGFQVRGVGNGEEALELIDAFAPDIVIADTEMPGMSGYELCERVKANPQTAQIPVIILYSAFNPFDEDRARTSGAGGTLAKPFESQDLLDAVRSLLSGTGEEGSAAAAPEPVWDEDLPVLEAEPSVRGGLDEEWEAWGLGEAPAMQKEAIPPSEGEEALKKAIMEALPGIVEKVVRESVREIMDSMRGVITEAIREGIPRAAEEIIRKEIEKITSQQG